MWKIIKTWIKVVKNTVKVLKSIHKWKTNMFQEKPMKKEKMIFFCNSGFLFGVLWEPSGSSRWIIFDYKTAEKQSEIQKMSSSEYEFIKTYKKNQVNSNTSMYNQIKFTLSRPKLMLSTSPNHMLERNCDDVCFFFLKTWSHEFISISNFFFLSTWKLELHFFFKKRSFEIHANLCKAFI